MTQSKHTPTPWKAVKSHTSHNPAMILGDSEGNYLLLANVTGGTKETQNANAEFIVKAVNRHDRLVEALEAISARVRGEFDHPALIKFGELGKCDADCNEIALTALAEA